MSLKMASHTIPLSRRDFKGFSVFLLELQGNWLYGKENNAYFLLNYTLSVLEELIFAAKKK